MRVRVSGARHLRKISVDIDIKNSDDEFVQLVENAEAPSGSPKSHALSHLVQSAWDGLRSGKHPVLCEEGVGGTYFMRDSRNNIVGVFKPEDEEPYNINNPKGYMPRRGSDAGFKEGILVGEASVRECAAYVLDYDNFSGVPPTDLVLCQHNAFYSNPSSESVEPEFTSGTPEVLKKRKQSKKVKIGSFQQYKQHNGDAEEISRSLIAQFPVNEVHKIALLDIRLFNTDRHGGNILYKEWADMFGKKSIELIPIDHSYTIPSTLDEAWFEWQTWPQAMMPIDAYTKDYVSSLDVEKDIKLLKRKFADSFRQEHFRVLRISMMLLKKAMKLDLTFGDIASVMCRSKPKEASLLEKLCAQAAQGIDKRNEGPFLEKLGELLDVELGKMSQEKRKD